MMRLLKTAIKALPPIARLVEQRDRLAARVAELEQRVIAVETADRRSTAPAAAATRDSTPTVQEDPFAPRAFPIDRIPLRIIGDGKD